MTSEKSDKNACRYYPFGMTMPGRSYTASGTDGYRFGFNTQEKDDEIYGAGNMTTARYWQNDARIGRRWNVDPRPNVSWSPYSTFANNPLFITDFAGDSGVAIKDKNGLNTGWDGDVMDKNGNQLSGKYSLSELNEKGLRPMRDATVEIKGKKSNNSYSLSSMDRAIVATAFEVGSNIPEKGYLKISSTKAGFAPKLYKQKFYGNQYTNGLNIKAVIVNI